MSHLRTFKAIDNYIKRHGGLTLEIPSCNIVSRKTGYFVSLAGGQIVTGEHWNVDKLSDFIVDNLDILSRGHFLGLWCNNDLICLDLTVWIRGKKNAINFGLRNCQEAIYNCKTGKAEEIF
jgi:hypothetical protein